MTLLGWSQSENLGLIGLNANRVLTMMSQVAVGWMLLDGASVAQKALAGGVSGDEEKSFYSGKIQSALWFARNVLPGVEAQARSLALEDDSALKVPESALGRS